ncbi:20539_t:CDS:2, partial [Gigaspora rosea]
GSSLSVGSLAPVRPVRRSHGLYAVDLDVLVLLNLLGFPFPFLSFCGTKPVLFGVGTLVVSATSVCASPFVFVEKS